MPDRSLREEELLVRVGWIVKVRWLFLAVLAVTIVTGRFRRDLYYRLNISSIYMSPLRERKGDVELLAHHFLELHGKLNDKAIEGISDDVMSLLEAYDYPGNVRELGNIIASAVVLESGRTLGRGSLPAYLVKAVTRAGPSVPRDVRKTLDELEAEHIRIVLEHAGGNGRPRRPSWASRGSVFSRR